jgi:PAS domain S-box-containing protein
MGINLYSLLPLSGCLISAFLGLYAIRANSRSRLNQIFSLFMFSAAVWGLSSFLIYNSPSPEDAFLWDKTETIGSILAASFMLHFCLYFTRSRLVKIRPLMALMYTPTLFFAYISAATKMLTYAEEPSYWGYRIIPGSLYYPFAIFLTSYTIMCVYACSIFFLRSRSHAEKRQALLLTTGIMIMLSGGLATEVALPAIGVEVMPLTSTLIAFNGIFLAYAMLRYKLMALTPSLAADNILKTIADYLLVLNKDRTAAFMSDSAVSALGYKDKEHLGSKLDSVFSGSDLEGMLGKIEKDGYLRDEDIKITAAGGRSVPVSLNGSAVKGGAGETLGYVLVMRDMSGVNELIGRLEERTKELEKLTKELASSKENLEVKMAESERLNKLSVGRELRMVELKKRIAQLEGKAGKGK